MIYLYTYFIFNKVPVSDEHYKPVVQTIAYIIGVIRI